MSQLLHNCMETERCDVNLIFSDNIYDLKQFEGPTQVICFVIKMNVKTMKVSVIPPVPGEYPPLTQFSRPTE